jgi:Protein of unknown function (DUF2851)
MKEDLLHFIWQSKTLLKQKLITVTGETLQIIHTGSLNSDAGPDFFNAKIKIAETIWAGNIEIHIKSSDWKNHNHQSDEKYNNVILHVVYHHDTEIYYPNGKPIPCLQLRNYISPLTLRKHRQLQLNQNRIACEKIFQFPPEPLFLNFMERLLVERLQHKCLSIESMLIQNNSHWENMFYSLTAKYFGMKTNAQPFDWLAQNLPLSILVKHKNSLIQIEALIFGVAGFLETEYSDEYINLMHREFVFLREKYQLKTLNKSVWKFARTRPANFPSVRLAQFASLIFYSSHLFSKTLQVNNINELVNLYKIQSNKKLNPYHFIGHETNAKQTEFGNNAIEILLINTVLPVMFLYGRLNENQKLTEQSISFYEQLKSEKNSIVNFFKTLGIESKNAFDSQALIQLKNYYCSHLKCLSCIIGNHILLN